MVRPADKNAFVNVGIIREGKVCSLLPLRIAAGVSSLNLQLLELSRKSQNMLNILFNIGELDYALVEDCQDNRDSDHDLTVSISTWLALH